MKIIQFPAGTNSLCEGPVFGRALKAHGPCYTEIIMRLTRAVLGLVLGKRLPIINGEIQVQRISQPVLVRRDRYGIPYIRADSEADAFYALGFCQGQDRAFQIERLVRTARGTLSEIFGPLTLSIDRLTARVGLFHHASAQLQLLDEYAQELLGAFAAGVNAGMRIGCRGKAPEFQLLGINPAEIGAADPLGILNFVALVLSPWPYKINRLMVLRECGLKALGALDAPYPEWIPAANPVGQPSDSGSKKIPNDLQRIANTIGLGTSGGSNSWAVNASRSGTGRPILANDPHLSPTIPSHWYLACLETPDYKLRGGALAGTPFFSLGHNQYAAWGVTGGSADNTDLFLEELDESGLEFRDGEEFHPLTIKSHTIPVKGQDPFEDRILHTPRGPIISDVLEDVDLTLSLRAPWMNPHPIQGLFEIYRVQSFPEFRTCWSRWYQAAMNMVYADPADTIGWQFVGDFPVRKYAPTIPVPGWDPDFSWQADRIPFENMPFCENPDLGLIATANTKPTPEKEPYLGFDFVDGYRLARIVEVLSQRQNWKLAGMTALQEDTLTVPWREMREIVLGIHVEDQEILEALALLAVWDGRVTADSPAASLYEYTLSELIRGQIEHHAPGAEEWALGKSIHPLLYASLGKRQVSHLSRIIREGPADLFPGSQGEFINQALSRAVGKLKGEFGEDPDDWAWGKIRPLTLEHPFGGQRMIGKIFNRGPFSWGGDSQTISQAQRSLKIPTYNPTGVANLRMVLDVGEWENNTFVLAGGQSGNPFSRHYDDQLPLWKRGKGLTLAWGESAIEERSVARLLLEPDL